MSEARLIKGGTVLSLDKGVGNLFAADVLIEDGIITEVGSSLRARHVDVVDATDTIVMPGFVDAHRHSWHALFRNAGRGPAAVSPGSVGPHFSASHVYAATLAGLLGAVEAGITTVVDWADVAVDPAYVDAVRQAHNDAGLRTILVAAEPGWSGATREAADLRALTAAASKPESTVAYGAQDPDPGDLGATADKWRMARGEGLRIHTHAGAAPASQGTVARLGESGLLGTDVTLVHCTNLADADLDAVASSGTMVAITPAVEMTQGLGSPPLQSLIDRGIRPGLGVGSELEAPGDIFAQMRAANSVQHATSFDLKLAGKAGVPNLLSTRDVIRYGTIDGAQAAGLGDVTGSLTPGKHGDVIVLRTDLPNIAPVNDPIGAVVWGMDTSNIEWVLVGGRALVADGRLTADVAKVRELAVRARNEVAAAAGLLVDVGTEPT